MVASGGDPEDESLDPELIHDLGLYELHDESRDGDTLGARSCPRASPRGRERPCALVFALRCLVREGRNGGACRAAKARPRAWIVSFGVILRARDGPLARKDARVQRARASLSLFRHRASL